MESKGEIIIYQREDGQSELEVHLQGDSVWLSQKQIASLFGTQRPAITKHLSNIFKTKELVEGSVSSILEHTAKDGKKYETKFYNLDAIISVGYRVNSARATQFRIWATQTLKDHLVKGYTINEKRLREQENQFKELIQTVEFLKTTISDKQLSKEETQGLLEIISSYTRSFILLNQFDSNTLQSELSGKQLTYEIKYEDAIAAIEQLKKQLILKKEASELFGRRRDDSFQGLLNSILQTFDGDYLYPGMEEQAAHLLYFVIKNHPFADGNKRIGAFLFIWFLHLNKHLLSSKGEVKINDNALVALALLVAQSDPASKELMIKLIINLVND
jgi:prophage maintenance system killer protein